MAIVIAASINTKRLNNKVDRLKLELHEVELKAKGWAASVDQCNKAAIKQNDHIALLAKEKELAQQRAAEAIKNVQPRVVYRQSQIKQSQPLADSEKTCEAAVAKAKLLLKDSPL